MKKENRAESIANGPQVVTPPPRRVHRTSPFLHVRRTAAPDLVHGGGAYPLRRHGGRAQAEATLVCRPLSRENVTPFRVHVDPDGSLRNVSRHDEVLIRSGAPANEKNGHHNDNNKKVPSVAFHAPHPFLQYYAGAGFTRASHFSLSRFFF